MKPPKRRHWCHFGGFIINFAHISHLCSSVSIVNFEQVNAGCTFTFTFDNFGDTQRMKWFLIYNIRHTLQQQKHKIDFYLE